MIKKIFPPLFFLLIFSVCLAFARSPKPVQDLFFEGSRDLVWRGGDELSVGKKTFCDLTVHYRGKDATNALVKIYLDGTNITSFSLDFKAEGSQIGKFSFRAETEAKHHLEFVIVAAGEFRDADPKNNRLTISFRVPGPVPLVQQSEPEAEMQPQAADPVQPENEEEVVEIPDTPLFYNPVVKELSPELLSTPEPEDAVAYLEREPPVSEPESEEPVQPETSIVSTGKPLIDVFFAGPDSFHNNSSNAQIGKMFSWILSLESSGQGEGEIEVVVADGSRKVVTQKVWIRAGETVQIPMSAIFDRKGPHRLTAMINTMNNIVDRNLENNIVEQSVDVS